MTAERWQIDEPEADEVAAVPPTMVASITYLWAAMRRRWRTWVLLGALGAAIAVGQTLAVPPPVSATTTLYLSHPSGVDPASAMQTDLNILLTRTVAEQTTQALGRGATTAHLTADGLRSDTTAAVVTSTVLSITVSAPTQKLALEETRTLAATYLAFRSRQLNAEANAQISGYHDQIAAAQKQIGVLTQQYDALSNGNANQQTEAADVLSQRSQLSAQVITLQQDVDSTALTADSVTEASHVLDPAAVNDSSEVRRVILAALTGLAGGLAVGTALVLFEALTSTRLRRREEVALAIGAPVRYAARRIRPGLLHGAAAAHGRQVLLRGLESADTERRPLVLVTPGRAGLRNAAVLAELAGLDLHPLDFDAGADELAERCGSAVLVVTAGRSSAEQLRTAAELLRASGIELVFALLIGTDGTDESSGLLSGGSLHTWRART